METEYLNITEIPVSHATLNVILLKSHSKREIGM